LLTRMVGPDFIHCYEALVFKLPGNGSSVPWHGDGDPEEGDERIFNIDIYPDRSTVDNSCVWVVPGSHMWAPNEANKMVARGKEQFDLPGAVPAEVKPGDVLLHHTRVLHGSTVNGPSAGTKSTDGSMIPSSRNVRSFISTHFTYASRTPMTQMTRHSRSKFPKVCLPGCRGIR
jgi:ectoine hydroxylase-related dioxygenase (phytanoyl-CoA dioxygenase family)